MQDVVILLCNLWLFHYTKCGYFIMQFIEYSIQRQCKLRAEYQVYLNVLPRCSLSYSNMLNMASRIHPPHNHECELHETYQDVTAKHNYQESEQKEKHASHHLISFVYSFYSVSAVSDVTDYFITCLPVLSMVITERAKVPIFTAFCFVFHIFLLNCCECKLKVLYLQRPHHAVPFVGLCHEGWRRLYI